MFSYVDKKIRKKLIDEKLLVTLNTEGQPVDDVNGDGLFISMLGPIPMPQRINGHERLLSWYPFVRRVELRNVLAAANNVTSGEQEAFRMLLQTNMSVNSVLALGDIEQKEQPLVRIHSCCMTGDVFGSLRCECGPQFKLALERIDEDGGGMIIYMSSHEGRGIGLWAKAVTYLLQDRGQDTYQANVSLGLPEDSRDFSDAAIVLKYLLNGRAVRLMSNNPLKRKHLEQSGVDVAEMVSHVAGVGDFNINYMRAKRVKGHQLPEL